MNALLSLGDIGDSLREAFFMFWETLWALVLGFGLSGAVQAFVSRGWGFLEDQGGEFVLPTAARAFLRDFNTGKAVKPFTFDLRLDNGS